MCGLTGFWDTQNNKSKDELSRIIGYMTDQIDHRGPDSAGVWCDELAGLALGHRRLSIVDLSDAGHQPMISNSERYLLTYNGEVYNFEELRSQLILEGCQFRGHSDTEVILEACELWGVETTCQRLNGMFAFALWDRQQKILVLARDRLGKKPLYWGFNQGILFFGSQLKSFFVHPSWQGEIDRSALTSYFRFNYIPTPSSIFKGIQKLKPAFILKIDSTGHSQESCYWDFREVVTQGLKTRQVATQTDSVLVQSLDVLLRDAVKRRMVADVPLGAFLSGGIDSSTVVALMQAQASQPVKTFSIGFYEEQYNEAVYAAEVAKHLGTDHHELYLQVDEARNVIPDIPNWCDEPFADASQIPTFLVSKMARKYVTVSLSGDGGDELFAGYNRYFVGQTVWNGMQQYPFWVRKMGALGIRALSPQAWDRLAGALKKQYKAKLIGEKLHKLSEVLETSSPDQFYSSLVSHWENPSSLVLMGNELEMNFWHKTQLLTDFVERMQFLDTLTYLPDDILTKVDRASMATSLETRAPLLDYRVVEFAWTLPMNMKIREKKGKWLLRQVLNQYVPQSLIERPKMGFAVPIDKWLQGPLRDWAENLLSESRLKNEGILDPAPIRQKWKEHLSGRYNWQYLLWSVLMFQAWKERWVQK